MRPGDAAALSEGAREGSLLELVLPRAAGVRVGGLRAERRGSSVDFAEMREYVPGDDLRHLEWAASARGESLIVRRYHDEVMPRLDLLLDGSASVFAVDVKRRAMLRLGASLASAAIRAGLELRVWLLGHEGQSWRLGPDRWMLPEGIGGSLGGALESWRGSAGGLRVLVSDLLEPSAPRRLLAPLLRGARGLWLIELLSTEELAPSASGAVRLVDIENESSVEIELGSRAVEGYLAALSGHRDAWRSASRAVAAERLELVAEEVLGGAAPLALISAGLLRTRPGG